MLRAVVILLFLFFVYLLIALPYSVGNIPNGFSMRSVMFYKGWPRRPLEATVIYDKQRNIVVPPNVANVKWTEDAVYGYREINDGYSRVYYYYSDSEKKLTEFGNDDEAFDKFLARRGLPKYWSSSPWTMVDLNAYKNLSTGELIPPLKKPVSK